MQYYFVYYSDTVYLRRGKEGIFMSVFEVILIGVALAMDAFALTVANCATYKNSLTKPKEWSMPIAFAIFQFLMPVTGYYIGSLFSSYISTASKYITAAIFFVLAAKIVFDNVKELKEMKKAEEERNDPAETAAKFTIWVLLVQAVATSIDALAVGVTFAVELEFSVFLASAIIGGVTFLIVAVALMIGKYLGKLLGKYATWLGALILVALAIKNLVEAIIG